MARAPAAAATRVEAVAAQLRREELEALLVSAPANLRYLTGYSGSSGLALVFAEGAEQAFFTDFRYVTQAEQEVAECFARETAEADLLAAAAARLSRGEGGRLGFEAEHLSVARYERLRELLASGWEPVATRGVVERLREVKDEEELGRIAGAAALADEALRMVLSDGLVGRTEREVADELELRMRRLGANGESFPSIVASGEHAALPHAQPRDVAIAAGSLVTIDWGAVHEGYCSDCTRTFAAGTVSDFARGIYELVLEAQESALESLRAGVLGREVDAVARTVIERAGHGDRFGHGLGHGVGLEVHEGPRLSRTGGDEPLREGNVVTVEPGVYLPGELGVRIEDLVVVTASGSRVLSSLPKTLTSID